MRYFMLGAMADGLSTDALTEIEARDLASADGIVVRDHLMADDRHRLLVEVYRLRALVERLQQGRPAAVDHE